MEILVTVTRVGASLTIQEQSIQLRDGDWVRWKFVGLAEGEFGFISFAPPLDRLGPFHSLRSFDQAKEPSMLGKGNKGVAGLFLYRALVLHLLDSQPRASGEGTIQNLATRKDTAPEITVTYKKEVSASNPQQVHQWLEVSPDPVGLNTGDTATWIFQDLPEFSFACFQFQPPTTSTSGTPQSKQAFGPFIAFNASFGDASCAIRASATGFAVALPKDLSEEAKKSFTYHIQLRSWDGELLAVHDPVIDNLGPPPPIGDTTEPPTY